MLLEKLKKIKYEIYVFVFFVLSRLPSLGYDTFTTDVWKWKQRIYDFGAGVFTINFAKTIQRYHPGVSLMWIGTFAVKVFNFLYRTFTGANPPDNEISVLFQLHFLQKFFIVLVLAFLLVLIFYVLKKLISLKYAAIAVILLSLEPFYVALTRVVHLEGLQATFMLASFMCLYMFVSREGSKKWLFGSSALAAFAVLTKTPAVFLVPFAGLVLFGCKYWDSKNFFRSLTWAFSNFLMWLASAALFFVLFWPAMWTEADLAIATLRKGIVDVAIEGGHLQMFLGEWVEDPGSTFYGYVFVLRSSLYLVFGLIGTLLLLRKMDRERKKLILFALLFALLYAVEISIPSKKLDRYLLPSMVSLVLVATASIELLIEKFSTKFSKSFWKMGLVVFLPAIIILTVLHPDYFSYYSILGGGLKKGIWAVEPKWVIGQHELMDYLDQQRAQSNLPKFQPGESLNKAFDTLDKRLVVAFPEKYYTQLHPFVRRIGGWATITSIKPESKNAEYIIFPVWFDPTDHKDPWEFKEQVFLRGVPIYNVYTNTSRFDW